MTIFQSGNALGLASGRLGATEEAFTYSYQMFTPICDF